MTDQPSVEEARERMEGDFLCEHPEGDAERSAGRQCQECIDLLIAAVRRDTLREVREAVDSALHSELAPNISAVGDNASQRWGKIEGLKTAIAALDRLKARA